MSRQESSVSGSRWFIGVIVVAAVAFAGYMLLGMPGMDHTATEVGDDHSSMTGMSSSPPPQQPTLLSAQDFAQAAESESAFLVNVHVPYDGELGNTDAFIRFDTISTAGGLPSDKGTEILVYCRSGTMSKAASATLVSLGYTNVKELEGGMQAWLESGLPIIKRPS